MKKSKDKGITLIGLVVVIIVIIVLTGITFGLLFKNGVIEKATIAKQKSKEDQQKEQASFEILREYMDHQLTDKEKQQQPNPPKLAENMIPVIWNVEKNTWEKGDQTNHTGECWYNYEKQVWANAVTVKEEKLDYYKNTSKHTEIPMEDISTMWVWVPRFSYTIGNEYGMENYGGGFASKETPGAIDIKFEKKDQIETGTGKYTGSVPENYCTHPAFLFGTLSDTSNRESGTGKEIEGFWIGKFETGFNQKGIGIDESSWKQGGAESNIIQENKILIKPGIPSWRYSNLAVGFNNAKLLTQEGNIYGFTNKEDSHMLKSTEWGAVAYLTQSAFGKYGNLYYTSEEKEVDPCTDASNGCNYRTGLTAGSLKEGGKTIYTYDIPKFGAGASTTGNIYGVYGMSGGSNEYVMAFEKDDNRSLEFKNSGFALVETTGKYLVPEEKYYNVLKSKTSNMGDGINYDKTNGWYQDKESYPTWWSPCVLRGGLGRKTESGIFAYENRAGENNFSISYRIALVENE